MTFDRINRRTHLYLGIALTPWFLLYALSSVVLNHGSVKKIGQPTGPEWTKKFEQQYTLPKMAEDTDEWDAAEKILKDHGMEGRYRARLDDDENIIVLRQKFLSTTRLTYYPKKSLLVGEDKVLRWNEFLTQAHFRAGYAYPYFAEILWAVMIDLLIFSTLIWIASGLILWIRLGRFRFWGAVALVSGMISFAIVVMGL